MSLGKVKIGGFILFTIVYIMTLVSLHNFLVKTPEVYDGVMLLAVLSTIVYAVGVVGLLKMSEPLSKIPSNQEEEG